MMDASMKRKVRAALRRGRARIADPESWIQGACMQDDGGNDASESAREPMFDGDKGPGEPSKFCASGALDVDSASSPVLRRASAALDRAALALDPTVAAVHGSAAAAFNDARTHAEVMTMYDVALALVGALPPAHDCDTCRSQRAKQADGDG